MNAPSIESLSVDELASLIEDRLDYYYPEAIEALGVLKRRAAPEAVRGWIACSEGMPDPNQQVLFVALGRFCVGPYRPDRRHDVWDDLLIVDMCGDCDHYTAEQVTHWMPQPPAPLEGSL